MGSNGQFGPLLGVIYVNNYCCKFLVYASRNAEILTCSEVQIKQISTNPGWLEFDPIDIWKCVQKCVETAIRNLEILDINKEDIVAIGVTNQRGTTVVWDGLTGVPLHNAIAWSDIRTSSILKSILISIKNKTNYIKSVCGLPLSTCFSALKIRWLRENIPGIEKSIQSGSCRFGTLESWILWNLTGGVNGGVHVTDVTNASYTMLMNIHSLQWDKNLCAFFKLPQSILPKIHSNSEIYGFIHNGLLKGIPIASCMGSEPAALLGQLCIKTGQSTCTVEESCFLFFNTGQEVIDSDYGLLTTVAYKLGSNDKTIYALEGAISNAGSSVMWLKNKLGINIEINQNENSVEVLSNFLGDNTMISSSCSSSMIANSEGSNYCNKKRGEIIFVPAFEGMYSPYWKYDARGLILGLTDNTTAEHIAQAAYEATGFQVRDVLNSFRKDTPNWEHMTKLVVGGDFSENNCFMQYMADIVGIPLERPQTSSPSCLGVMLAAGVTMNIIDISSAKVTFSPPSDMFYPTTTNNRRDILYQRWNYAVKKCINWNNFQTYEQDVELFTQRERDPYLAIRKTIPGALFLTFGFVALILANFLQGKNIK